MSISLVQMEKRPNSNSAGHNRVEDKDDDGGGYVIRPNFQKK
jgi:hypothetical protein